MKIALPAAFAKSNYGQHQHHHHQKSFYVRTMGLCYVTPVEMTPPAENVANVTR